jgi:hypothetical protein
MKVVGNSFFQLAWLAVEICRRVDCSRASPGAKKRFCRNRGTNLVPVVNKKHANGPFFTRFFMAIGV